MAKRDTRKFTAGKSPTFQIRIIPDLRKQLDEAMDNTGMSLRNWFKELTRKDLKRLNIEPKKIGI
ncbi:toxin-antitoxin system HicB family antitoxin [Brenneria roseae subsp. roseae]|nr:toxin-antitoxin system HicB family antitoxin [Brenneria roseae]PWC14596.1 toxin-antitoxin system HicB family antitoxin [Brenneria roseae subsp. roseae]